MIEGKKVGITGHQNIGSAEITSWVHDKVHDVLVEHKVTYGFTSLAIGADQMFTDILLMMSVPYMVVIPSKNYESTFKSKSERERYRRLLSLAEEQLVLDYDKPSEKAFFDAGKYVVRYSDLIIAVWNGEKAKGLGGTADVVEYARTQGKSVIHINNIQRVVGILR